MPDDLTRLQEAVDEQRRMPRAGAPVWIAWLRRAQRTATCLGLVILLGVVVSAVGSHMNATHHKIANQPAQSDLTQSSPDASPRKSAPVQPATPIQVEPAHRRPLPTAPRETHRLGEAFTMGIWEYCVTSRQWHESTEQATAAEITPEDSSAGAPQADPTAQTRRTLLTILLSVSNGSQETALLPTPRLAGPDGENYDALEPAAESPPPSQKFRPGARQVRRFTFAVPRVDRYSILLQAGWLSDQHAAVEIEP